VWLSRTRRWLEDRQVDEFDFRCNICKVEYRFSDGKLRLKEPKRDLYAEALAVRHAEVDAGLTRRSPECGGPLKDGNGLSIFRCGWCFNDYVIRDGELTPRPEKPKPRMRWRKRLRQSTREIW